ncbi:hypothetical protein [Xylocopilactobacillus apis]|uniref:Uncharacterized protein n=1 Tax=Xylocopilactobacillus apis TaxID=2932183 RepID=A0AAU9CSZ5_9LACO|nr:hypothetical protein [Xylocopilactobacillus apis]BDR57127.1 hypothetical protein KIMC2_16890 [Xylocopilactobacillus apis]
MKEDVCGISMPPDKKISMITFRGLITNTSYTVDDTLPRTHYRVFIEKVYDGDRSKEGTFSNIEAEGGKIKNSVYYRDLQEKSFIPQNEKLTPAQLNQYTLVQSNSYDPSAPGDEIILTMPVNKLAKCFGVGPLSNVFYRQKGQQKFLLHHYQLRKNETSQGRINSYKKMREEDQKSENSVNEMVKTGIFPKNGID